MRPFHFTWFPCRCPGTVTLVLLCSWPPSSTGSPSFAGVLCGYSQVPPAPGDLAGQRTRLRSSRRTATHCPSPPTATARAPQSLSWPLTEKSGGWGGKKGECTNEYVKESCEGKVRLELRSNIKKATDNGLK